jgi:hypothetical protein
MLNDFQSFVTTSKVSSGLPKFCFGQVLFDQAGLGRGILGELMVPLISMASMTWTNELT